MTGPETHITNEGYYEHYRFEVPEGQRPLRIDKFLIERIPNASRNRIQNAAKAGCILVNDQYVKQNFKVKPGQLIAIVLPEPPRDPEIKPEYIPLDIAYEDDWLLVINKPANLVVHPGHKNYSGTLVNGLTYYFDELPTSQNGSIRPGLVHRLDKDTTGLMVVTKDEYAMTHLASQFFHHTVDRKYNALVWGEVPNENGTIEGNLARSKRDRRVMQVYEDDSIGKRAITHYQVLERLKYATLIECWLETGRTHQIRAHMKYLGHPVLNDQGYGGDQIADGPKTAKFKQFVDNSLKICPRQALHAKVLGFDHPQSGERLSFNSELPKDMQLLLEKWRRLG